jgi:hypothetical protein
MWGGIMLITLRSPWRHPSTGTSLQRGEMFDLFIICLIPQYTADRCQRGAELTIYA